MHWGPPFFFFLALVLPWGWAACTDHHKSEGKPWLPASPAGTNPDGLLQMVALLTGKFNNIVEKFVIVDCRYPYEYEGGHIKVRQLLVRPGPPFRFLAERMTTLPWSISHGEGSSQQEVGLLTWELKEKGPGAGYGLTPRCSDRML